MRATRDKENICVKFSEDEALVLLEWLSKLNSEEHPSLFEDQAEERILFDLESSLEKVISETFEGNYLENLSRARQEIKDKG